MHFPTESDADHRGAMLKDYEFSYVISNIPKPSHGRWPALQGQCLWISLGTLEKVPS
jgi:hypothetical protein